MVKLTVLYGAPADPEAFDAYYAEHHVPLVHKVPGLRRFEAAHVVGTRDGSEPPYYLIAELWFDSAEAMQESMATPAGQAPGADVPNFATGGATVLIAAID
jgi:uncharacterized protein (TIGR02118 family)